MTIEELQAQILQLQTEKQTLETDIQKYKDNEEVHKTTIAEKDAKIDELRKFNNDLFLRVQQPQTTKKNDNKGDNTSISDIINKLS